MILLQFLRNLSEVMIRNLFSIYHSKKKNMYLFSILFALYLHANYKASRNLISNHLILCKQINLLEMENPAVLVQYTNKWRRKLSKSVRSLVVKACDRVRVVCGKHGVACIWWRGITKGLVTLINLYFFKLINKYLRIIIRLYDVN